MAAGTLQSSLDSGKLISLSFLHFTSLCAFRLQSLDLGTCPHSQPRPHRNKLGKSLDVQTRTVLTKLGYSGLTVTQS